MKPRKSRKSGSIVHVKSGIGLSGMAGPDGLPQQESFLASRTARVLLAGAGFLADAVSTYFKLHMLTLMIVMVV